MNKETAKTLLDNLCESVQIVQLQVANENQYSLIIDLSDLENKECQDKLIESMIDVEFEASEQEYYQSEKDKFDDESDFEDRAIELFINNLQIKDYIKGIIGTPKQYGRIANQCKLSSPNFLQFLQYQLSTLKRVAAVDINDNLEEVIGPLKDIGVQNRPPVSLVKGLIEIDIGNVVGGKIKHAELEKLLRLAYFASKAQSQNQIPILEIRFSCSINHKLQLLENSRIILSTFNQFLIEQDVQTECTLLLINLPELYLRLRGPIILTLDYYHGQDLGREIAFKVVKTLTRSLPPSFYGVLFTFEKEFARNKAILHFINQLHLMKPFTAWSYGIVVKAQSLNDIFKSYSKIRRFQSATVTLNLILKQIQEASKGSYKPQEEQPTKDLQIQLA